MMRNMYSIGFLQVAQALHVKTNSSSSEVRTSDNKNNNYLKKHEH